jgi:hypothetical protein
MSNLSHAAALSLRQRWRAQMSYGSDRWKVGDQMAADDSRRSALSLTRLLFRGHLACFLALRITNHNTEAIRVIGGAQKISAARWQKFPKVILK